MNSAIQFEDRASSRRSKHEGESSSSLCDRLSRTRAISQRQLPTDHDYAVSTREYQTDQSSLNPAPTAACPVLENEKNNDKNNPTDVQTLTESLHIREVVRLVLPAVSAGIGSATEGILPECSVELSAC
jgi:hypothetical protein